MKKIFLFTSLIILIALTVTACSQANNSSNQGETGTSTSQNPENASVVIRNFSFVPAELLVKKGVKVTWTNEDSVAHTITSTGNFDSGTIDPGQSYTLTFHQAGIFDYICSIHPSMKGKINVTE